MSDIPNNGNKQDFNESEPQRLHIEGPQRIFSVEEARERMQSLRESVRGKLPFETQCAIFAFAYDRVPNRIIARAFEVSKATVSHITGCLDAAPESYRYEYAPGQNADVEMPHKIPYNHNARRRPNRKKQYERVAREFEALGEEEFYKRYMTAKATNKIIRARRELIVEGGRIPVE